MIRIDNITCWGGTPGGQPAPATVAVPGRARQKILDSISCTILPGLLTVLLGPNGAGKSTLLRILSGEKKPHTGVVYLNDQPVHSIPLRRLALQRAMLTQHYSVSLPFTVEEVVMMGRYPHYRNSPSGKDREIVSECLRDMQVAHLSDRHFNTLSGGEQQRVQMARVLAQLGEPAAEGLPGGPTSGLSASGPGAPSDETSGAHLSGSPGFDPSAPFGETSGAHPGRPSGLKILLLDEPTASMDLLHQQQCLGKARQLAGRGYTVVAVLHDLNLAAQFADTLLLLKDGKLLAGGKPSDILKPDLIYTAYGMETVVLYADQYDFPVIIPALSKDPSYFSTSINQKIYAND